MSGLLNNSSLSGSASNLQDNTAGRPFSTSFSAQSGAPSPVFQHSGSIQGLHNIHGSFNVPSMPGTLGSRNSTMANVPSSGLQQPSGNLSSGRFTSNIPVALSQISHGNSHGHPGLANRGGMGVVGSPGFSNSTNAVGGSIPGILPTSAAIGNRNAISVVGASQLLGNSGPRITSSAGNIVGGGSVGRSINPGGGLSMGGLSSRLSFTANSGSGNIGVQGSNRLMGGMLQQASPQVMSMLGNSYHSGGPLSQNHVQAVNSFNSMGMLNDVNNNDGSPFDINDFPQLSSRPSSSGGAQGQIGSLRKQGLGVSPIVQQNQEFSIQNEDFPALPGFKGSNADYSMDLHQKDQVHENNVSMMQSPHFSIGRSSGTFSSHHPQQQSSSVSFSPANNQDLHHLHGSDMFQRSHSSYHSQASGPPGVGLRPLNSQNTISGIGSYDQLIQHYPPQQNQSQFRLQQMSAAGQSYRDQGMKSLQAAQTAPDRFGLLGLLSVIRMSDPDLTSLALGIDLTTLGLNLNSAENLHRTFGSPWSDESVKGDPDFTVPQCYYSKQAPVLNQWYFSKFQLNTLFYIFYSMPQDEAQLYAANELHNRGWFYHREHRLWFMRAANIEPLVKTNAYERGSFICFDPNTWETIRKDNFVVYYEMVEKRAAVPQH
ncbi:probable NOT transcription complex subunit VIP2 isoform X1 [Cynara cardunculus var. scolymus]|uniref:probable NOT transcription complex subunit VIP2 isoform X1 n=2 Tax=Cynara cardunculus var. scolymus TaxID=59895 RepID=UPI000D6272B4|nr:probable NOT transcription complex subunit VIP2 isoform X1 [Cynara cardunculus var. scolymus]XP_024981271.1 probable NOT transcription complex subunit VIP2 isoform X1 [Cynara cardunculus var. scolymus]XP_024981272.1 probable NOT transcription complex subunit VIP2 isoform X1 [Cynara cardunculus var. scolymus]XP_024981273.1 probable NOT transcription complex subunit VIP2 isoform X1 [Cynara cardunculus var. scolymus]